jgi:hypothetical protein
LTKSVAVKICTGALPDDPDFCLLLGPMVTHLMIETLQTLIRVVRD